MDWQSLVKTVAPAIGNLLPLPPPLGALAAKELAAVVLPGKPDPAPEELAKAAQAMTPEQMALLKERGLQFASAMKKLGVDVLRIEADDRSSARNLLVAVRSRMPAFLTVYVVLTFTAVMVWAVWGGHWGIPVPEGAAGNILMIGVGLIVREVTAAFAFWMGSSDGSKAKDQALGQQLQP